MSTKKQKLNLKRSQASEEPAHDYDHEKFVNANAAKKFNLISKNRSFIKEKGFHHPDDFFRKTIVNKGWRTTSEVGCHNGGTRVLRQYHLPRTEKGPGAQGVGKLQCEVYQSLL